MTKTIFRNYSNQQYSTSGPYFPSYIRSYKKTAFLIVQPMLLYQKLLGGAFLGVASIYAGHRLYQHFAEDVTFISDLSECSPSNWMASSVTPTSQLSTSTDIRSKMEILCMELQAHLCHSMETIDKKEKFLVDKWEREDGRGGGISCVLQDGAVFEKAGVNISVISSELTESALHQMRERLQSLKTDKKLKFDVVGISSVNHPSGESSTSAFEPTDNFNIRCRKASASVSKACVSNLFKDMQRNVKLFTLGCPNFGLASSEETVVRRQC
nr:unnamed protein product [Spirometra erinaceieuropaei]